MAGPLAACNALSLLAVAALLFAFLLRRSGLHGSIVASVVAIQVVLIGLIAPLSAPLAGFFSFASGTCAYAALVVRRTSHRWAILAVAHVLLIVPCFQASPIVAIVFGGGLATLTGLFLTVGASTGPVRTPNLTATDSARPDCHAD